MINLNEMSDKELAELQKLIMKERKNRGNKVKANSGLYGRFLEMGLEECLQKEGLTSITRKGNLIDCDLKDHDYTASHTISDMEKAIYKVCDIILGNYKIKKVEKTWKDSLGIAYTRTEGKLLCNGTNLYDKCYKDYMHMTKEISDICEKYYKGSLEYRNKRRT